MHLLSRIIIYGIWDLNSGHRSMRLEHFKNRNYGDGISFWVKEKALNDCVVRAWVEQGITFQ